MLNLDFPRPGRVGTAAPFASAFFTSLPESAQSPAITQEKQWPNKEMAFRFSVRHTNCYRARRLSECFSKVFLQGGLKKYVKRRQPYIWPSGWRHGNFVEDGDYYKIGSGSSVAVGGKLYVRELDAPLAPAIVGKLKPGGALTVTTSLLDFEPTDWTAQTGVVLPTTWGGADGVVACVNVTIENLLLASTLSANSAAFIEKKFAALSIVTSPVPEPEAWVLFLGAGAGRLFSPAATSARLSGGPCVGRCRASLRARLCAGLSFFR